jgi:hypothetical protein
MRLWLLENSKRFVCSSPQKYIVVIADWRLAKQQKEMESVLMSSHFGASRN